ncbi:unnamed protein product [Lota lota]
MTSVAKTLVDVENPVFRAKAACFRTLAGAIAGWPAVVSHQPVAAEVENSIGHGMSRNTHLMLCDSVRGISMAATQAGSGSADGKGVRVPLPGTRARTCRDVSGPVPEVELVYYWAP